MQSRCVTTCNMAHNVLLGSDDGRTEREKMMAGDLYYSFAPKAADLEQDRAKCRIKVAVGPVKLLFLLCHNTIAVDTPTTCLSVESQAYNASRGLSEDEQKLRLDMLADLFGSMDTSERAFIEPPFSCDYVGANLPAAVYALLLSQWYPARHYDP